MTTISKTYLPFEQILKFEDPYRFESSFVRLYEMGPSELTEKSYEEIALKVANFYANFLSKEWHQNERTTITFFSRLPPDLKMYARSNTTYKDMRRYPDEQMRNLFKVRLVSLLMEKYKKEKLNIVIITPFGSDSILSHACKDFVKEQFPLNEIFPSGSFLSIKKAREEDAICVDWCAREFSNFPKQNLK